MTYYRHLIAVVSLSVPVALFAATPIQQIPTTQPPQQLPPMSMKSGNKSNNRKSHHIPKFKQADRNHDGKIEWREAQRDGVPKKLFKQEDSNGTGWLSKTEWAFVRLDMNRPAPGPAAAAPGV